MSLLLPVSYPAKVYSHSDAGAPTLTNTDGAIKTILKGCLVTGYGDQTAAGWQTLFEDSNRIVLRLPDAGQVLGSPDLKIENGAGKYRIVTQNNPTGLDDATEIASASLLSRDSNCGEKWQLVVTDVGFVLWYQMAENSFGVANNKGYFLIYTAVSPVLPSDPITFVASYSEKVASNTGIAIPWMSSERYKNMLTNVNMGVASSYKTDINTPDSDVFQQFVIGKWASPVGHSLNKYVNKNVISIKIGGRDYLRALLQSTDNSQGHWKNIYVPTDYWEV